MQNLRISDAVSPVILKPAVKDALNHFTYAKAWRIDNQADLLERHQEAYQLIDPALIMVQELIPGGGECQFSYGALCQEGRPLASVVARRTRQYPVDFGRSKSLRRPLQFAVFARDDLVPGLLKLRSNAGGNGRYCALRMRQSRYPRLRRGCLLEKSNQQILRCVH